MESRNPSYNNLNSTQSLDVEVISNPVEEKKTGFQYIRYRTFQIIEPSNKGDYVSLIYDTLMIINIFVSILPLAFKTEHKAFVTMDIITVAFFIIDYFLRWLTADFKLKKKTIISFIKYPITVWAIIDLLSILPSLTIITDGLKSLNIEGMKLLRILRLVKTFKIIRIFKTFRYSNSLMIIAGVIKRSKYPLIAVGTLSLLYVLTSSLIIFNVESSSFENFFDAVYWATVSLTTVGYGDIYPTTTEGRIVAMISSIFGIALVALPSGIITAGYMDSINERNKQRRLRRERRKHETGTPYESTTDMINEQPRSDTFILDKDITNV